VSRNGTSRLEQICETYDRSDIPFLGRYQFLLPHLLISQCLKRVGLDKESIKKRVFHNPAVMRALAVLSRSIVCYGSTIPQEFVLPLLAVWKITRECSLNCQHCCEKSGRGPGNAELSLAEKLGIVDELATAGVPFLRIAGGEPLVCKDIWPVIEYAQKRRIHVAIASNGALVDSALAARLVTLGVRYFEVNLHSLKATEHDAVRGRQGAWSESVAGIKNLVNAGMRTGLAMPFPEGTVHGIDGAVQFAKALGCEAFSWFNLKQEGREEESTDTHSMFIGRDWLIQSTTSYPREGRNTVISATSELALAGIFPGRPNGPSCDGHAAKGAHSKNAEVPRSAQMWGPRGCFCAIQPNGDVTPGVDDRLPAFANLRTERLTKIWCGQSKLLPDRAAE
jgi:MoaA/NifB/PqqE/SkfB family radical SAM enzyme